MKTGHFYINKVTNDTNYEDISVNNKRYSYFDIVSSDGEIIDTTDFINIKCPCRIDVEENTVRIYPCFNSDGIMYDEETHTIDVIKVK